MSVALTLSAAVPENDLLYWMEDSGDIVLNESVDVNAVRVAAYSTKSVDAEAPVYLSLVGGEYAGGSVLPIEAGAVLGGKVVADISNANDPSWSFVLEIGNWNNDVWTVAGRSANVGYADAVSHGYARSSSSLTMTLAAPFGSGAATPEPTGGVLTLWGLALLALRRRSVQH